MTDPQLQRERWIAWIRLGAIPFSAFQVAISTGYPDNYRTAAWIVTGVFTADAVALYLLARRPLNEQALASCFATWSPRPSWGRTRCACAPRSARFHACAATASVCGR